MATTIEREHIISAHRIKSANLEAVVFSDKVLTDFIVGRNKKSLKDLKGKISFRHDYDYKLMRS